MITLWFKLPFENDIYQVLSSHNDLINNYFVLKSFNSKQKIMLDLTKKQKITLSSLDETIADKWKFKKVRNTSTNDNDYVNSVNIAIEKIKSGVVEKVVLARQKCLAKTKNPIHVFKNLCANYPNCMVHLCYAEDDFCSIGASPELLLSYIGNTFSSSSMAGTTYTQNQQFSEKEILEQDLVTKSILQVFKKFDLAPNQEFSEINNGHLTHLYTKISATYNTNNPTIFNSLLEELHPTPAVAGVPKQDALALLANLEKFDREWYAGYLGIINQNSSSVFVNLRCARYYEKEVVLYAGAGITLQSNPEKELQETKEKMKILEQYL